MEASERVLSGVGTGSRYSPVEDAGAVTSIARSAVAGRKADQGKLRWSLVPWVAVEAVVCVLEFGAQKYGADNWKSVSPERYREALLRHAIAYAEGERYDRESGLPTLAHLGCNVLFLLWFERDGA